jgi:hypothetical protein
LISLALIVHALAAFAVGLAAHIVWWRAGRPRDDVLALFLCVVLLPLGALTGMGTLGGAAEAGSHWAVELFISGLLAAALGCCYIILYPGAQAASPSMLLLLTANRIRGGRREELLAALDSHALCEETLKSLVNEKFARLEAGRLVPLARGAGLVRVCQAWRSILGLRDGEG